MLRLTADWCCSAQAEAFPQTGVGTGEPRPAQPGTGRQETVETVITPVLSYQHDNWIPPPTRPVRTEVMF